MTTPADIPSPDVCFTPEDELGSLDWSVSLDEGPDASQEINDRRAQQESPETLRLVRAL